MNLAAGRLAVLSRQLANNPAAERNDTAAEEETRPAPGGGRGTLTVVDNRTGKKYTVRIAWDPRAGMGGDTCCADPLVHSDNRHAAAAESPRPLPC